MVIQRAQCDFKGPSEFRQPQQETRAALVTLRKLVGSHLPRVQEELQHGQGGIKADAAPATGPDARILPSPDAGKAQKRELATSTVAVAVASVSRGRQCCRRHHAQGPARSATLEHGAMHLGCAAVHFSSCCHGSVVL